MIDMLPLLGIVVALVLLALLHPRRRDELPKTYEATTARPLGEALADLGAKLSHGSPSLTTWRRACQLSLERSRARRSR